MTMANTKRDTLELVQLSLDELGLITGGKGLSCIGALCASPDDKPPHPYFP